MHKLCCLLIFLTASAAGYSQQAGPVVLSGRVADQTLKQPVAYATVHLVGSNEATLTRVDGTFRLRINKWHDSLEITHIGYNRTAIPVYKNQTESIKISLIPASDTLKDVVIKSGKTPGKQLMELVIENKHLNDPDKAGNYSFRNYTRNELTLSDYEYKRLNDKSLQGVVSGVYAGLDSSVLDDKELPLYFSETLLDRYHMVSPALNKENVVAKKSLGLKTDGLLRYLEKFYFNFDVYKNWIPVFDQTYVSPLNNNAFYYYNFFIEDTVRESNTSTVIVRFTPKREYERAFSGSLWINDSSYAVQTVVMRLTKTANLNYISDIKYTEDYSLVYDSASGKMIDMPSAYSSEVKFESGFALLGIPVNNDKKGIHLISKSTSVLGNIQVFSDDAATVLAQLQRAESEKTKVYAKSEDYWKENRLVPLTSHEKTIYKLVDSLKENHRFIRDIKVANFIATGAWDFSDKFRLGYYSTFLSRNNVEGWRFRIGFWTLPGISKKINLSGYGAWGSRDHKLKGLIGIKYLWNESKWTKTSLFYGSDYDFIVDQDDELDKDNIISSFMRKNVPYTRTYVKQFLLQHEQYISRKLSAVASVRYRELTPVFDFSYNPINPILEKPVDSVFLSRLPVAEGSIGLRFAPGEKFSVFNYDIIHKASYKPILTAGYTFGFELAQARFEYSKINLGIQQNLHLPPKSLLYYKLEAGKTFGTIPYILLNVPGGNEFYVASKYLFNTMAPYEFAADKYISLHTRLSMGGVLLDKVPFLKKLGWRERVSFNSYWGSMSQSNIDYNRKSNFNLMGKTPFMEAGIGIENIFHVMSVEYIRRLNYLQNPYAIRDGIFLGVTLKF